MILGLGCDIVQVSRFAKKQEFLLRFMKKYFTDNEINELENKIKQEDLNLLTLAVATRFAAKEAVSKALGSGFQKGITLKDVEIVHNKLGKPEVNLYNNALARAYYISDNQDFKMHITISNEREYVNAVAVIECA
ncbi:MAG: holo-[acyl-carrier-protein] synthase [Alphaproteobacteria bacterium]|jgi:holo-[acyl-carrier protein] synthase|nr:holo-[acyl-carrier-protein] synthase [Alphaproteobacteria bacterium]